MLAFKHVSLLKINGFCPFNGKGYITSLKLVQTSFLKGQSDQWDWHISRLIYHEHALYVG